MYGLRLCLQVAMILTCVVCRNMWVLEAICAENSGCHFVNDTQPIPQADKPDF